MSRIPPRKAAASMVSGMSSRVDDSHSTISTQSMPQNLESARSRQNRRDETIRKRFQSELMKKSGSRSGGRETQSVIPQHLRVPGTVGALRPTQALTVREAMTVLEAARLMAAKRADCVLVVDSHEHLAGIFTAKDLAFRVVAEGQEARNTTVRDIMTRNPFCVTADTPATDALTTMVKRRFRHLPVCNDEGDVVGLLDITRCMSEALEKMERAYNSSRKLYEAVEGVEREWSSVQPAAMMQFVEALREKMSFPTLGSVLNEATHPVEIGVRSNVREAAQLMKAYGTTAVITKEGNQVAGIFTSKDVVLRVIAAGLNPDNCTLVRVMTPHPDVAPPTMTLLEALRKMYDGRYLNLPVMDNGILIGMVDVLRLTYHTLEQINNIEGTNDNEGPVWSRFFSIGEEDALSEVSESHIQSMAYGHPQNIPHGSRRPSDAHTGHDSGILSGTGHLHMQTGHPVETIDEIYPNESASAAGLDEKLLMANTEYESRYADGTFAFKFKDPRNGYTHRFVGLVDDLSTLRSIVMDKLGFGGSNVDAARAESIGICYIDSDGDPILMTSEDDLIDAVATAKRLRQDRVMLVITGLENETTSTHATNTPTRSHVSVISDTAYTAINTRTPDNNPSEAGSYGQSRDFDGSDRGRGRRGPLDNIKPEYLQGAVIGLTVALISVLVMFKIR